MIPAAEQSYALAQAEPPKQAAAAPGGRQASAAHASASAASDSSALALEKTIASANDSLEAWSTGMRFDVDSASGRIVVSITDGRTGEVLRTVPTDAVLRAAKMIMQIQEKSIDTHA